MANIRYCWTTIGETHEGVVSDFESARKKFESAQLSGSKVAPMVEYWTDAGRALAIGAGLSRSTATFQFSLDPPYYVSKGNDPGGSIDFIYGKEPTEYGGQSVIEVGSAFACLSDFFASPALPRSIEWVAV